MFEGLVSTPLTCDLVFYDDDNRSFYQYKEEPETQKTNKQTGKKQQ